MLTFTRVLVFSAFVFVRAHQVQSQSCGDPGTASQLTPPRIYGQYVLQKCYSSEDRTFLTIAIDSRTSNATFDVHDESFSRFCSDGKYSKDIFRCVSNYPVPETTLVERLVDNGQLTKTTPAINACIDSNDQIVRGIKVTLAKPTPISALLVHVTTKLLYNPRRNALLDAAKRRTDGTMFFHQKIAELTLSNGRQCRLATEKDYLEVATADFETQNLLQNRYNRTWSRNRKQFLQFICDFDHDRKVTEANFESILSQQYTESLTIELKPGFVSQVCDLFILSPKPFDCQKYSPDAPRDGFVSQLNESRQNSSAAKLDERIAELYRKLHNEDELPNTFVRSNLISCKLNYALVYGDENTAEWIENDQYHVCGPEGILFGRKYKCTPKNYCKKFDEQLLKYENLTVSYSQEYHFDTNGFLAISDGVRSTIAIFACLNPNHTLTGQRSISCDPKRWSHVVPSCGETKLKNVFAGTTGPAQKGNFWLPLIITTVLFVTVVALAAALVMTRRRYVILQREVYEMQNPFGAVRGGQSETGYTAPNYEHVYDSVNTGPHPRGPSLTPRKSELGRRTYIDILQSDEYEEISGKSRTLNGKSMTLKSAIYDDVLAKEST